MGPTLAGSTIFLPLRDIHVLAATPPRKGLAVMASEDSPIDVARMNQHGASWTKPKHVEPGDLALMYYLARHEAVCCRPRASSLLLLASPPR